MRRCFLWLMVCGLLVAALAAGCDDGGEGNGGNGAEPSATSTATAVSTATSASTATPAGPPFAFEGPVGIDLTTYGVFHSQGEPVPLTITVAASEPITLYYRTTQRYEIVISDADGKEVWRWSRDKAFGEVLEQVNLEENGLLTFNESWDQKDNDGQPAPPGNYTVTATSTHCDANYENCGQLSASHAIQIRAS